MSIVSLVDTLLKNITRVVCTETGCIAGRKPGVRSTGQEAVVGFRDEGPARQNWAVGVQGGLRACQHRGGRAGGEGRSEGNSYIKSRWVGSGSQWEEVPQAESERLVLPVVCWGLLTVEPSGGGSKSRAGLGYAGDVLIL